MFTATSKFINFCRILNSTLVLNEYYNEQNKMFQIYVKRHITENYPTSIDENKNIVIMERVYIFILICML